MREDWPLGDRGASCVAGDPLVNDSLTEEPWATELARALCSVGFTLLPKPKYGGAPDVVFRAMRGHCEVHVSRSGEGVSLSIPVVKLGPERPVTERLTQYLEGRNASGKGPGVFHLEGDTVWYRAPRDSGTAFPGAGRDLSATFPGNARRDAACADQLPGAYSGQSASIAAIALAMQETVEKLGPKILNLIR